jgi:hypothetical protein
LYISLYQRGWRGVNIIRFYVVLDLGGYIIRPYDNLRRLRRWMGGYIIRPYDNLRRLRRWMADI